MSHIVRAKISMQDHELLDRSIKALGHQSLGTGTHALYAGQKATGYGFRLPGWNYPVVVNDKGEIDYDNYNGSWGKQEELDKVCQKYTELATVDQLVSGGYQVEVQTEANGDLVITGSQFATA